MQRPDPNKMFRFPSLALSLVMVGRSGGQKKKKKKKKKKREWTLEGDSVPENAGMLSKKAWLQSQLEPWSFRLSNV